MSRLDFCGAELKFRVPEMMSEMMRHHLWPWEAGNIRASANEHRTPTPGKELGKKSALPDHTRIKALGWQRLKVPFPSTGSWKEQSVFIFLSQYGRFSSLGGVKVLIGAKTIYGKLAS